MDSERQNPLRDLASGSFAAYIDAALAEAQADEDRRRLDDAYLEQLGRESVRYDREHYAAHQSPAQSPEAPSGLTGRPAEPEWLKDGPTPQERRVNTYYRRYWTARRRHLAASVAAAQNPTSIVLQQALGDCAADMDRKYREWQHSQRDS